MHAKLESLDSFTVFHCGYDTIRLIEAIKGLTFQFEDQKKPQNSLFHVKRSFSLFRQGKEIPNATYLEKFQIPVSVVEQYGGGLGNNPGQTMEELRKLGSRHNFGNVRPE